MICDLLMRVWLWLLIDGDDIYPACRICWKLSSVLPGKATTGSCHTLAAALKLLTGRLGEAIYWEMPCPWHSLWSLFMGAGQWMLLDPCTLRVECGRNKGTMLAKPRGLKGSRGKSSHSPEWGLYFFLHPDNLSTIKSQRLSSWQSVESEKAIKSRSGVQGLSVANCHSQVIRLLSFHAQSFIHTLNSVPQWNNSMHLCVCCMCVFVGTCLWRPETGVKCLPLLPAIICFETEPLSELGGHLLGCPVWVVISGYLPASNVCKHGYYRLVLLRPACDPSLQPHNCIYP